MEFLQNLVAAIVITFWNYDYCSTSDIRGKYYHAEPPYIEVCQVENKKEKYFYTLHELGHFFWFKYLTDEEKELYKILFENSNLFDYYREYSKTNSEEDTETAHIKADSIICDLLEELWYWFVAEEYDKIDKWYT